MSAENDATFKRIDNATRGSANQIAGQMAELLEENIQTHVYDYYDGIRSGLVTEPYQRTFDLLNGVEVRRGRLQASVVVNAHTPQILDDIQNGVVSPKWKNSILYRLSPSQRMRPFMQITIEEVNSKINNYFTEAMDSNGIHVVKR